MPFYAVRIGFFLIPAYLYGHGLYGQPLPSARTRKPVYFPPSGLSRLQWRPSMPILDRLNFSLTDFICRDHLIATNKVGRIEWDKLSIQRHGRFPHFNAKSVEGNGEPSAYAEIENIGCRAGRS
jgi:hypothetical protein